MKFKMPKFPKLSKLPKLPKRPQLSALPHLPKISLERVNNMVLFLQKHKISVSASIFVIAVLFVLLVSRDYVMSKLGETPKISGEDYYAAPSDSPLPAVEFPSPSTPSGVLGTSTYSPPSNNAPETISTPFPTFAPLPTVMPVPTPTIVIPTTTNSSSSNNSGNSNCTTGSGVPNAWYSDVYPNPPVTTNTGSITLLVYIRDCNKNTAPVNDSLTITLSSSDSTAKINGSSSPVTIQAQNGQASFSVSSQNNITDYFTVQDTTNNFTVTDINNHNPSVTFTNTVSGNSNCTTASGVANFWYSEVSPASPISANTGSTVTLTVNIKDCNKNNVSSDNLTFSQTSSDSSLTVNGHASPITVQAQNGVVIFDVTSQNTGTDTFTIQDTTGNFTVTDANNHNPSIVFSGPSSTPAPTPSASPTPSPSGSPTPTTSPSGTPTPTPSPSATPTPT